MRRVANRRQIRRCVIIIIIFVRPSGITLVTGNPRRSELPMAAVEGYSYAYGWNGYYQMILGVCENPREGSMTKHRAWAWAGLMIIFIWIPQTASLSFLWGDLNSMIDCLSTNLSIAISIAKILALQCQRRVIGSILDSIAKDWTRSRSKDEIVTMFETARISRLISMISVSVTNLMFVAYVVSQVWTTSQNGNNSNADSPMPFGFLFDSYFPFDTTNPIVFVTLWIGQLIGTLLSMISYSGPDCIVSMMVLHVCGQLRIVRNSLKSLVNETTVSEPKKYWKALIPIVKRHEELNRLSLVIRETFSSILLVQMLTCSVTFCFQGYVMFGSLMDRQVDPVPIQSLAFSFLYAGFTVIHLFVYCYVGDRLLVESTKIPDDFYETPWYNLAPKEARAFLFVCHRSKIPLRLAAGKFCTFNLQLFNSVLKNSMGYLSMLMAMRERLID